MLVFKAFSRIVRLIYNYKKSCSKQKPGFLFVLPWSIEGVGGVNEVVLNLYDAVEKGDKFKPFILVNDWSHLLPKKNTLENRTVIKLRLRSPYSTENTLKRFLCFWVLLPLNGFILWMLLRYYNVKIINPHYPELSLYIFSLLKLTRLYKGKFILSFHGSDIRSLKEISALSQLLWNKMIKRSDGVVACSHALKNEALSAFKVKDEKIFVIHNGVKKSFKGANEIDTRYNFSDQLSSSEYILSVGTFEYTKGQDILIKAFSKLSMQFSEFKLVLVGRKTEYLEQLIRIVDNLNINQRVWFFCDIPHKFMGQFFQFARFFVLPSRIEAFGIVLLEAGIFKLPVIASNVGGIPEIVQNGITGKLVQPENIEQLSKEMEKYCLGGAEIDALGINLHNWVGKKFSWEGAYKQYMKLCGRDLA